MLNVATCCRYAAIVIFGTIGVIIVSTFRHYGVTWDEELQSQYGIAIVDYYASLFQDHRFEEIFNLYLYGGMFDGLASLVDLFTPYSVYETRHLVNALFGLLGLWGTWKLGRFFGPVTGLASLVLLVLTPMYYGHMFNNPKDIPFAAGIVWVVYFMAKTFVRLPRARLSDIFKLGITLGLTLGIRVGGVMTIPFWCLVIGAGLSVPLLKTKDTAIWQAQIKGGIHIALRLVLPVLGIAYLVMLACWPWAQQSPIMNPVNAFNEFRHFPQNVEILLDGVTYMSTELPWYYVPLYFGVQLPESLLFLLAIGIPLLPWTWMHMQKARRQAYTLVLLTAFVPIIYTTIGHPALYDAVRHFIFAIPLMCVAAALAARSLFQIVVIPFEKTSSRVAVAGGISVAFCIAFATQFSLMIALHPYEYIYVNEFAGGVPGAYGRYELDYWGSSFKEAAKRLQAHVAKEGGVPDGKIYRIAICGPWAAAMIYLPPDFEPVEGSQPAEFFLSTTRWMCQNMRPGKEIFTISRLGVPLAVVKDLRKTKK